MPASLIRSNVEALTTTWPGARATIPCSVGVAVANEPGGRDRVCDRVECTSPCAGVRNRLGKIVRAIERSREVDVTDLFHEVSRVVGELDRSPRHREGRQNVEVVAIWPAREVDLVWVRRGHGDRRRGDRWCRRERGACD